MTNRGWCRHHPHPRVHIYQLTHLSRERRERDRLKTRDVGRGIGTYVVVVERALVKIGL